MAGFINLYPMLVEAVFGGLLLAGIGIAVSIVIIGMFARMSQLLITVILFAFFMAYGIGYVGALVAIPAMIFAFTYFFLAVYHWYMGRT